MGPAASCKPIRIFTRAFALRVYARGAHGRVCVSRRTREVGPRRVRPHWHGNLQPCVAGPALRRPTGFNYPKYFGNCSFSLKKIRTFHCITTRFRLYANAYHRVRQRRKARFLDDLFLGQYFPKLSASFRIVSEVLAQQFSTAFRFGKGASLPFTNQDNDTLSFGIHGWIQ